MKVIEGSTFFPILVHGEVGSLQIRPTSRVDANETHTLYLVKNFRTAHSYDHYSR